MITEPPGRKRDALRATIAQFLNERLQVKLDSLAEDDPKRASYTAQYTQTSWLADAARRAGQIQAVTHTLKPIHSDARGSNLYCPPDTLPPHDLVGSHCLGDDFAIDIVGNAAALDVYKLLKLSVNGHSLLSLLQAGDSEALAALSDDAEQARAWADAFAGIAQPRGNASTHTRAKQLYWLVGDDPRDDNHFELLAPLYASSLAQQVYQILQMRFGEAASEARQARKEQRHHDGMIHEYPHLAVQKLGGTKPQNISQLNSERRGDNYLLASLPPRWEIRDVHLPINTSSGSIFTNFGKRDEVKHIVVQLREFLLSRPPNNMHTRNTRDELVLELIDQLLFYAAAVWAFPAGWSATPECNLKRSQQLWLDFRRAETDPVFASEWRRGDWVVDIRNDFARWLNARLRPELPVGDPEHRQWQRDLGGDALWLDLIKLNQQWLQEFEAEQGLHTAHVQASADPVDTAPQESPA